MRLSILFFKFFYFFENCFFTSTNGQNPPAPPFNFSKQSKQNHTHFKPAFHILFSSNGVFFVISLDIPHVLLYHITIVFKGAKTMNKLGINLEENYLCYNEALPLFKNLGFDAFFTAKTENMEKIAVLAQDLGLFYECIHAPFSNVNTLWSDKNGIGQAFFEDLKETITLCGEYNIPKTVMHCSSKTPPPTITDLGVARFDTLVDLAVKNNVTIALENLRSLGNIASLLERYSNVKNVGFCWDVGHEYCFTKGSDYMKLFGDRICYTHIHDNTCEYDKDYHLIPFDGKIDYAPIVQKYKESGYSGTLTLETSPMSCCPLNTFKNDPVEYYKHAYEAAVKLKNMF